MENNYYKWIFIPSNKLGLTHVLHDKVNDKWFFVHASKATFPAKFESGVVTGITTFTI